MNSSKAGILALVCSVLLFSAVKSWASDPIGVYGIIEKVVFEPSESSPQRIQIWGAFALTDGQRGDAYLPPQRGYLYYTITPGEEDICRKEWADLQAVAGTGQGIGFGSRYGTKSRLRQATEKAQAPDTYEIGVGLIKIDNRRQDIFAGIREALKAR